MSRRKVGKSLNIAGDTHTHTLACGHAFSTLGENIAAAGARGHRFLCYTEHGPAMVKGMNPWFFQNQRRSVPRVVDGIVVLLGCEANILDETGAMDLSQELLGQLDWVIASLHDTFRPQAEPGPQTIVRAWKAVAQNPYVDCIGHLGNPRMACDYETVVRYFKEGDKIVELNCSSHKVRPGSDATCRQIAALCKAYGVPMVLSSDAHFYTDVGEVEWGLNLVRDLEIPEELILNLNYDRFCAELKRRRDIDLPR